MIRAALITLALTAPPALAQSVEEQVRTQLGAQGFTEIDMQRTLLGRLRVVATSETHRREIVINPGSGAILRDYWEDLDGDAGDDADGVRVFIPDAADDRDTDDDRKDRKDDDARGDNDKDRDDDEDDDRDGDRDDDRGDREDEDVRGDHEKDRDDDRDNEGDDGDDEDEKDRDDGD